MYTKRHTSGTSFIMEHGAQQTKHVLSLPPGTETLHYLHVIIWLNRLQNNQLLQNSNILLSKQLLQNI